MASACALHWVPDSLYNTAVSSLVSLYSKHRKELKSLPANVQFDIYYKLYNKGQLCLLGMEFSELDIFSKVLRVSDKRHCFASIYFSDDYIDAAPSLHLLHHCFQALMDHGVHVSDILSDAYSRIYRPELCSDNAIREKAIHLGFHLGSFLSDAGWFQHSERVFMICLELCRTFTEKVNMCRTLECCIRLLYVQNADCRYSQADVTAKESFSLAEELMTMNVPINRAALYTEYCALMFAKSQYDEAFKYAIMAVKETTPSLSHKAIIDVLRQSSKACVVKREFKKAEILIKQAICHARKWFSPHHPKYSDALVDYGFYLLNVDSVAAAVQVHQMALDIRQSVFGGNNLYVALAHEDLAYASYVNEYSTGRFDDARNHAEKAIEILSYILPETHLQLSSSKRVKALILEEIAIDDHHKINQERLLSEAQDLHLQSLALARKAFGENNVMTAKHYGNLGRLYQSMNRYREAEDMHLKAIEIKEKMLGDDDYEVALSVGHLASLYNYDMEKYTEAEQLYHKSIAIGKKLFGNGYSGLEYDYRGLQRLYMHTLNHEKAQEYSRILQDWNQIREINHAKEVKPLEIDPVVSIQDFVGINFTN